MGLQQHKALCGEAILLICSKMSLCGIYFIKISGKTYLTLFIPPPSKYNDALHTILVLCFICVVLINFPKTTVF